MGAEVDDESQRGARGGRRRYFLASVLRRERDARARRMRFPRAQDSVSHESSRDAGEATAPRRLALPVPAYMPLAGDDADATGARFQLHRILSARAVLYKHRLCTARMVLPCSSWQRGS
jgi:hypothetical protein